MILFSVMICCDSLLQLVAYNTDLESNKAHEYKGGKTTDVHFWRSSENH